MDRLSFVIAIAYLPLLIGLGLFVVLSPWAWLTALALFTVVVLDLLWLLVVVPGVLLPMLRRAGSRLRRSRR